MNKNPSLTKICSHCGLEKPLSAFLQMSGQETANYGALCNTCRKTVTDKNPGEGSTRGTEGKKIDAKAKVQQEADKRQLRQDKTDADIKEQEKQELEETKVEVKTETVAKQERKHREDFLSKRSFLSGKTETGRSPQTKQTETIVKQAISKESATHQEQASKEEQKQKSIDLTGPYIPSQTGAQIKMQGDAFKRLVTLLGTSAPVFSKTATTGADKSSQDKTKESLPEFIEKSWGPKRGK